MQFKPIRAQVRQLYQFIVYSWFYLIKIHSINIKSKELEFSLKMSKQAQEQGQTSINNIYPICSPPSIQQHLYSKYSSSQIYFYTSKVNQIVKQKRTQRNIQYQDIEYICDQQEYLKRWYQSKQYEAKMFTFKEYYFYHEDCPRIFMKGIEEAYTKWQDKKRDLVYKKLKLIYNEDYQSEPDSVQQITRNQVPPPEHFLLDISEYNPYSKKYYLRVQQKKKKQREKRMQEAKKNQTKFQLSQMQHDLSQMLNELSQLSEISTLYETPRKSQIYQSRKVYHAKQTSNNSQQMTASNSNTHSSIKFNFKKHKGSDLERYNQDSRSIQNKNRVATIQIQRESKDLQDKKLKNLQIKDHAIGLRDNGMYGTRISPKFATNPTQTIKSNSVFSVSSFGVLNKKPEIKINSKRELLKINFQPTQKKRETQYQSEKPIKIVVKSQSQSNTKINQKKSLDKIRVRQISVGKTITKPDQFSDKKFVQAQNKLRSHKSEFSSMTSLKKPLFKIKQNIRDSHKQINFGLQNLGMKRTLQLKHY